MKKLLFLCFASILLTTNIFAGKKYSSLFVRNETQYKIKVEPYSPIPTEMCGKVCPIYKSEGKILRETVGKNTKARVAEVKRTKISKKGERVINEKSVMLTFAGAPGNPRIYITFKGDNYIGEILTRNRLILDVELSRDAQKLFKVKKGKVLNKAWKDGYVTIMER